MQTENRETARARGRYDRIARIYDLMESSMERRRFSRWRERLWTQVRGPRILEVGVGTGKNFPYYQKDARITAIDFSPRMLDRARRQAQREGVQVELRLMDAQHLEFPDDSFDSVVATFVFCSVPDPVQGLRELGRVTTPQGRILLLEHVRPGGIAGRVADALNPMVVTVMGANINRCTVENVQRAGLEIEKTEDLWRDIVKLIVARPEK
jgi:ubiquinone/menaquinone biosynthesis C-methylase UbiE